MTVRAKKKLLLPFLREEEVSFCRRGQRERTAVKFWGGEGTNPDGVLSVQRERAIDFSCRTKKGVCASHG